MGVRRLNHAVLYVRDARRSAAFYCDLLGFEIAVDYGNGAAVFLRAAETTNDHDLGLFTVGERHAAPQGARGLYHLAWQVGTIDELASMRDRLHAAGSLVGQSDHGVSKSLYAKDPDGIEFEVMWAVPIADRPASGGAGVLPLDLRQETRRWSGVDTNAVGLPVLDPA